MNIHPYIENLAETLNTQENCGCSTPIFAVYVDDGESGPELDRLFITETGAWQYIKDLSYRLKNPKVEVLGCAGNDLKNLIMFTRGVSPQTEERLENMSQWKPKNYYG